MDIERLDGDVKYYKSVVEGEKNSPETRRQYKKYLSKAQKDRDLAILKERNITN